MNVINEPSFPLAVAGAVTTGRGVSFGPIVSTVDFDPLSAFAAVKVTVNDPIKFGVQLNVP